MTPNNPPPGVAKPGSSSDSSKTEAQRALRESAEQGATQAKESYEKLSAATREGANLFQSAYSTAISAAKDYNVNVLEMARENTNAAFDYLQELAGVKTFSQFVELSNEHGRQQLEALNEQTKELAALVQHVATQTAEPWNNMSKGLNKVSA